MKKKIARAKKIKSPKRIESVPHRFGALRAPTSRTSSAGSNRGPAITEIDSSHLHGGRRLTGDPSDPVGEIPTQHVGIRWERTWDFCGTVGIGPDFRDASTRGPALNFA